VGNVEPTMIASDQAPDVLVADGFTGNILLKTMEGTANFIVHALKDIYTTNLKTKMGYLMIKDQMGPFKKSIDSREVGGSAMMGIQKPVVKAHGNSDEYAFQNAMRQAVQFVRADVVGEIEKNIDHMTLAPKGPVEKLMDTIPTLKKD
jgi:glycerol-3-phosphate acyltransferase PlsX